VSAELRPAGPQDVEDILCVQASRPDLPCWSADQIREELAAENVFFEVLTDETGKTIGYFVTRCLSGESELRVIAVAPDAARKGYGRRLLMRAEALAARAGAAVMKLEVSEGNSAAQGLYAGAGYCVVGRRANYYNDGSDALLMDKNLK